MKILKHLSLITLLLTFTNLSFSQEKLIGYEIGNIAPEIQLASPNGDIVTLSSLRGKVVLLDFWAGWCGPCRRENPVVLKTFNEYRDKNFSIGKGFTVYGVSLDKNRESWTQAIKKDNLTWTQVSDLKYWQSPYVSLYNIRGIPANFLLDKNGVIIAKNLRGERLSTTLDKYLIKDPLDELKRLIGELENALTTMKDHEKYSKLIKEQKKLEKHILKLKEEINNF